MKQLLFWVGEYRVMYACLNYLLILDKEVNNCLIHFALLQKL